MNIVNFIHDSVTRNFFLQFFLFPIGLYTIQWQETFSCTFILSISHRLRLYTIWWQETFIAHFLFSHRFIHDLVTRNFFLHIFYFSIGLIRIQIQETCSCKYVIVFIVWLNRIGVFAVLIELCEIECVVCDAHYQLAYTLFVIITSEN